MPNSAKNDSEELRQLLNESQYEAAVYSDGPELIVAGAGSGKTRVLTYKIAYLLQQGWHPSQILALTFTNKAAREMKERIAAVVGEKRARYLWMGTFHSIFARILRSEAEVMGFNRNFTIYDQTDSKNLIRSIIKEMALDDKVYRCGAVQSRISNLKNQLITPELYQMSSELRASDRNSRMPLFYDIFCTYRNRCAASNAFDFDDLLLYTNMLFEHHPDVLARYQEQFAYILVDEYQDTNIAQHSIISQLAGQHKHICVVGDDAQSIYSFRGANIDNMLLFEKQFTGCRLFKLERNYRSTQTIVNAANSLIEKNEKRIRKKVYSEGEVGEKIKVLSAFSDYDEAFAVAASLGAKIAENNDEYSDYAILYRTNAQSRVLEEALRKRSMPYKIYGGLSFYQHKEVKDVLAYLRLVVNANDEESFRRVVNYPARGIGETTQSKLLECAHRNQVSALDVAKNPAKFSLEVNKGAMRKLMDFAEFIVKFQQMRDEKDAYALAEQMVIESGIVRDLMAENTPEAIERKENVQEVLNAINQFCEEKVNAGETELRLEDFLSEVALLTDQDNEKEEDHNRITLMTVHSAKGLEFKHVYIVGLEENLFPSLMCCESEREIEEERRLLYVAITRAKKDCTISYAKSRFRNGQTQMQHRSRFLDDIDAEYLQMPQEFKPTPQIDDVVLPRFSNFRDGFVPRTSATTPQKTAFQPQTTTPPQNMRRVTPSMVAGNTKFPFRVGMRVHHERFGDGEIVRLDGDGDSTKAIVQFDQNGQKPLLLKYARLTILS